MQSAGLCHICGSLAYSTCRICFGATCPRCLIGDVCRACKSGKKLG